MNPALAHRPAEPDLEADAELEQLVTAEAARLGVPGAAVGVLAGGRAFACSVGVTDVDHPRPVSADTHFLIGSTTKTMTATAVMSLVQEGLLSLDDCVIDHLPELRLQDTAAAEQVTVGQLLDHTAGWRGDFDVSTGWGDDAVGRSITEVLPAMPQLFAPGSMASYNNLSFIIAGHLLERLTGETYAAVLQQRVLDPLGMTDTFLFPWEVATRSMAAGHVVQNGVATPAYTWPISRGMGPAGGAISTVRDQLRYAQFHIGGGAALSDDVRMLMQQPRIALPSTLSGIGISWLLKDRNGVRMATHGGNCSNLFVSGFALATDENFAVTVLANSSGGGALSSSVTEWAVQHYLGKSPLTGEPPLPLTPELSAQYVGHYDAGQWDLVVTAHDGKLFVQMQLTDVDPDTPEEILAAFRTPPAEYVLIGPDVIALAGNPAQSSGDFVRDPDGTVRWLRSGLRLARRP